MREEEDLVGGMKKKLNDASAGDDRGGVRGY